MKITRMRMSKEAARLIHDYRDEHDHKTNTDAIFGIISDNDVSVSNEICLSRQLREKQDKINELEAHITIVEHKLKEEMVKNTRVSLMTDVFREGENAIVRNRKLSSAKFRATVYGFMALAGWGIIAFLVW